MANTNNQPFYPDKYYHVYHHANGGENLYRSEENYRYFLERYAEFIEPIATTYAYCLLPNHFHLLVKIKSELEIKERVGEGTFQKFETFGKFVSKQFSNFLSAYTQSYNKYYSRKGSLFMQNLRRKPIDSTAYLCNTLHYIHYNPVHHQFCKRMEDWLWSSYTTYLLDKRTRIARDEALRWFGNSNQFAEFHRKKPDPDMLLELDF